MKRNRLEIIACLLHRFDCEDDAPEDEGPAEWDAWWNDPTSPVNRLHYYRRAGQILHALTFGDEKDVNVED